MDAEQKATLDELRAELADLDLQADDQWSKWIATGDRECLDNVNALEGEIAHKALVAHLPRAGEKKISKIEKLIEKLQKKGKLIEASIWQSRVNALNGVNEWRESMGLPLLDRLPRGITGDSHECTLARAFKMGWDGTELQFDSISVGGDSATIYWHDADGLSQSREFSVTGQNDVVGAFDNSMYPDLIDDEQLRTLIRGALQSFMVYGANAAGDGYYIEQAKAELRRANHLMPEVERREFCSDFMQELSEGQPRIQWNSDAQRFLMDEEDEAYIDVSDWVISESTFMYGGL